MDDTSIKDAAEDISLTKFLLLTLGGCILGDGNEFFR